MQKWRSYGDIQAQLAFVDENGPSDATLTVAASTTGLRLFSGSTTRHRGDSSLTGHIANLRAPQLPNFETQALLLIRVEAARELGTNKGSSLLKGSDRALTTRLCHRGRAESKRSASLAGGRGA
ncbi:hypothetical protein TcG_09044 [Trypanosoma cruzi]|nr:hypothetical protein TcG_09044 [Trypanosoma cruzi]